MEPSGSFDYALRAPLRMTVWWWYTRDPTHDAIKLRHEWATRCLLLGWFWRDGVQQQAVDALGELDEVC
jgi:hypothetical protein